MTTDKLHDTNEAWPDPSRFNRSIRFEFTLIVSGILLILMLSSGYMVSERYVDTVTRGVVDKLLTQARSYSGPAGKLIIGSDSPDALLLCNTCKKLAADNPDVYWAGITNSQSAFIAHTDIKQVVTSGTFTHPSSGDLDELLRPGEGVRYSNDTIFISVPIQENNHEVGRFNVASSTEPISRARTSSALSVLIITFAVLLVGMPAALILLNRRLKPIAVISEHLKAVDADSISIEIPVKSKNELGYLSETLKVMGSRLNIAQKAMIEKERYAHELEIAREIQASILPKEYPNLQHLAISGTYSSAKEVGGDYYDFFPFDDNRFGFLVADVSGKSLPGMLVMLMTRDIVRKHARADRSPAQILSLVNRELNENIRKGTFVTMFMGVFVRDRNKLIFASAGHNPLLHLKARNNECNLIKTKGYPLGMMPGGAFDNRLEEREIDLHPDDILIQYTDGVNEALDKDEQEYGLERISLFARANVELPPDQFVQRFTIDHNAFVGETEQYDDITLIVMKYTGVNVDTYQGVVRKGAHVS